MKTAKQRVCELHRLAMLAATLLITLSGLAIRTYFTTMRTADDMTEMRADVKALLRNDAAQDQRERDGEKDRNRIHQQLDRLEDRGRDGER